MKDLLTKRNPPTPAKATPKPSPKPRSSPKPSPKAKPGTVGAGHSATPREEGSEEEEKKFKKYEEVRSTLESKLPDDKAELLAPMRKSKDWESLGKVIRDGLTRAELIDLLTASGLKIRGNEGQRLSREKLLEKMKEDLFDF